jgi:signal transduction histidine kinase
LNEIDRTMMALFAWALAAMLVVGIAAAALIGGITRRRLARLDATAQAIIGGDLARRAPRDGSGSEFDRLAGTLNHMLDRLEGLMDNLREVSSDVAHDLRTPLTRLYNRLDLALAEEDASARTGEIEAARAQAGELLEIFAALLRIVEIEGMAERLPRQEIDLSALLEQMAETYRPDMDARGHHLRCEIEPGITIMGDRRLLSQAIANLLDNALSHTPAGTIVTVSLSRSDGEVRMAVSDDGAGVAGPDAERLFQRFARSERARSTPGHGLGLSLVAAIAAAHGGHAALGKRCGFEVVMILPG